MPNTGSKRLLVMVMAIALTMSMMAGAFASGHSIISPTANEFILSDTLNLKAQSGANVSVRVAVRATTEGDNNCSTSTTPLIYRDISNTLSTDGDGIWEHSIDVSAFADGLYCFAFDPADAPRISVKFYLATPTSKDACKNGGWMTFGDYKNQGQCVSGFASGK